MAGKRKSPRHMPGAQATEAEPRDEEEVVEEVEAGDEVDPVEEAEAAEEVQPAEEEEEAAEVEIDLTKKDDFKKGYAFSARYSKLMNVLQAAEDEGDDDEKIDKAEMALTILCKQGRHLVTEGAELPSASVPPPRKKDDKNQKGKKEKGKPQKTKRQKRGDSRAELKRKGIALVGSDVDLIWPRDGKTYGGLIIGYDASEDMFKVYFWGEGEVCDDVTRDLIQFTVPDKPRKLEGLVGMRIFFNSKSRVEAMFYEAFVVGKLDGNNFKLIRTGDDVTFVADMSDVSGRWGLLENGKLNVRNTCAKLVTWSEY